ncbi:MULTISPECIES: PRC and DUF2382 domain-containing protein [unclassified Streptomyces]|uniref:PRC and DUF2382 domain-containing protein n=1 Tax=unclassified Streptomyces TaxID=2593676 RepID=UPI002285B9B7|nr:PRC and DUF2382 domain-containing protein [Streptomyces sp. Je 1-369]WAL95272.1 PRC and DUF2382 domain-containing protein [Streptomyces sp. Je 1-369]
MTQGEGFTNPDGLTGLTAYDRTGEKIGSVEQVYLDDRSGRPEWVTVKTGLFGMKQSFVPLAGARRQDDQLHVATTKEAVKDAPRIDADQHIEPGEEHELYAHYGLTRPEATTRGAAGGAPAAGMRGREGMRDREGMAGAGAGAGMAGAGAASRSMGRDDTRSDEMIRSEERLRVGTEEEVVGQARLRKVVVTEDVKTSVPLSHEEVRVVREPIREGDGTRANIGEAEAEVTLHAEKAVVRKESVPVERVRLETEKVTETEEVSDTVRKEQIEYDRAKGERGAKGEGWRDRKQGPRH